MRILFILTLFFFIGNESFSQRIRQVQPKKVTGRFFEKTELGSNDYVLFFTGDCNRDPEPPPRPGDTNTRRPATICNFYTDDQELIRQFASIKTEGRGDMVGCGYHFDINLTHNKKTIHASMLNTECNQLETPGHGYKIDLKKFDELIKKTKPIHRIGFSFKEKSEAVAHINKILADTSYLSANFMIPIWYTWDGRYSYEFKHLDTITPIEEQQKKFENEFIQLNPNLKAKPRAREMWTGYWRLEVLLTEEEYTSIKKAEKYKWTRYGEYGYSFSMYRKGKGW